jgi:hydroxymethylbilane synthase
VPVGAYAEVSDGELRLLGLVASLDGTLLVRDEIRGPATVAVRLGTDLAERVLAAGGESILEALRYGS